MKTRLNVVIDTTSSVIGKEHQMEMLAYVRNSLSNFTTNYPESKLTVSMEVSDNEIMEAIRGDSQTKENCYYFDEAQGRHKCNNDLVKSSKCTSVCKFYFYWNKTENNGNKNRNLGLE